MLAAIRVSAAEIRALHEATKHADTVAEDDQPREDLMRAAEDLERADDVSARTMLKLPPHDELNEVPLTRVQSTPRLLMSPRHH